jgi:hypothetical protein
MKGMTKKEHEKMIARDKKKDKEMSDKKQGKKSCR